VSRDRPEGKETADVTDGLPSAVRDFLDATVRGSLLRYDVLRFYHQNPYAILTLSDLSVWVPFEERALAEALRELAALGYLTKSRASAAFTLDPDREKRRQIEAVFGYLQANPDVARRIRARLRHQLEVE
jgi:hypothetical protein